MGNLYRIRKAIKANANNNIEAKRIVLGYESDFNIDMMICESLIEQDNPCKNEREWDIYTAGKIAGMKWYREQLKKRK